MHVWYQTHSPDILYSRTNSLRARLFSHSFNYCGTSASCLSYLLTPFIQESLLIHMFKSLSFFYCTLSGRHRFTSCPSSCCKAVMWPSPAGCLWQLCCWCVPSSPPGPIGMPAECLRRQPRWSIRKLLIHYSHWAHPIAQSPGPPHTVINAFIDYQASSAFVWLVKSMPF